MNKSENNWARSDKNKAKIFSKRLSKVFQLFPSTTGQSSDEKIRNPYPSGSALEKVRKSQKSTWL